MGIRRRLLFGGKKSRLPSEYQEVEYIATTVQTRLQSYILTGVSGNSKKIELKYERISTVSNGPIIITSYNTSNPSSIVAPWAAASGNTSGSGVTITPSSSVIDTPTVYTVQFPSTSYSIRIGGWSDTAWTAASRYYYVKIYDGDNLVFDGVPCYRKSDSKTGLFDIVNQAFIPNSGSSEFGVWPNV